VQCISICESELNQHLTDLKKVLKRPRLEYVTVAGIEVSVLSAQSRFKRWLLTVTVPRGSADPGCKDGTAQMGQDQPVGPDKQS